MVRSDKLVAQVNGDLLNKAVRERNKTLNELTTARRPTYDGEINAASMGIQQGELVVQMPDGTVTSALNGLAQDEHYDVMGVAVTSAIPTAETREPRVKVNVAIAGSVAVRNVGHSTFGPGDHVYAVSPNLVSGQKELKGRDRRDDTQLMVLVKATSRKPNLHSFLYDPVAREFIWDMYQAFRVPSHAIDHTAGLTALRAAVRAGGVAGGLRYIERNRDIVKLVFRSVKIVMTYVHKLVQRSRGQFVGVVEEDTQVMPGEDMSVYVNPAE